MRKLIKLFVIPLLFISGCRYVSVKTPDKTITYINAGFDTRIGQLHVKTTSGSELNLSNLDSNSQALSIAAKALDVATATTSPLP